MVDRHKYRVFSKFFSLGSFSLFVPFIVVFGLLPKDSELYRSGPLLGAIWFLVFAATSFFSCATIFIVGFRRYRVSAGKLNCFDLVWMDPLDPIHLSASGRWRILTVFLLMSAFVNASILLIFEWKAIGLDQWTSPIFFLFWGNVLYSIGLLESIYGNLKSLKFKKKESQPEVSERAEYLPLLGEDLCLGYRAYWVFAITLIVVCVGYALNFTIGERSMERSPSLTALYIFLLVVGVGVLFVASFFGAKLLRFKTPDSN
ncbi:MAG: hypothetical protein U1E10_17140 [Bdellovibrionales bacterium]|nr:hypothetical protein [Bdellovibrionales bacterium]